MASVKNESTIKKEVNRGAWTDEEDQKLAQAIEIHGAKKWKTVAAKAGVCFFFLPKERTKTS